MKKYICAVMCAAPLMFADVARAVESADILWLTETPPLKSEKSAEKVEPSHAMHDHHAMEMATTVVSSVASASAVNQAAPPKHVHDATEISLDGEAPGKDYRAEKQIWLRQGDDIKKAKFIVTESASEQLTMIALDGQQTTLTASNADGRLTAKIELPAIGFYNTYLEKRAVRAGQLVVQLPKAELMWASCQAKEVDEESVAKPIINASSPLEIVRLHSPDEGCMSRIVSGTVLNFVVYRFGKPQAGVAVSMVTQEGWRNTKVSDGDGKVSFTVIREYYPNWLEFNKFHTDTFLTVAEWQQAETGILNGEKYTSARYVATLPGKYRPSPYDYRSYAWGLGISFFVIVFGGLAIYLYRRRRIKPYQEVRFDDKA